MLKACCRCAASALFGTLGERNHKTLESREYLLFVELLRIALGIRTEFSVSPANGDWEKLYRMAKAQTLVGVLFGGVERLPQNQRPPFKLLMEWIGMTELIKRQNKVVDGGVAKLMHDPELSNCKKVLLKGQAVAQYYPHPELRMSGDIDLWCVRDGMTLGESLESMVRQVFARIPDAGVQPHHTDWTDVDGVGVELHFTPSTVYSFFKNYRVQRYFEKALARCEDGRLPVDVDVVFQLMHLRRHLISEGVGMRQVVDLYWTLLALNRSGGRVDENGLSHLGLHSFASAMMYVMQKVFLLDDDALVCRPDAGSGSFVLNEILRCGNFGRNNTKNAGAGHNRVQHLLYFMRLSVRCLRYFPRESICAPLYRIYVGFWKKRFEKYRRECQNRS